MSSRIIDSIIEDNKNNVVSKKINLNLDLAYPELPTKYYAQSPLPRPKRVGYASLIAWLLYSNRFFLDSRWFQDHSNFWARNALMKLTPITHFFHLMAFLRPTIQRSWFKVIWIIIRFVFVILTIVGVVGLAAFDSAGTWSNHLIIGLLATGLAFISLNILCWVLSFVVEKYFNERWKPDSKNKRLYVCLDELVSEAKRHFKCDRLIIHINVLILDNNTIISKKVSKKTIKQQKKLEKEISGWKKTMSVLVNEIMARIPDIEFSTSIVKKSISDIH